MDETDSKIRLLLELTFHPLEIQITSYTPLRDYDSWCPEKMYDNPNKQYYYVFINDKKLINRITETQQYNKGDDEAFYGEIANIEKGGKDEDLKIEFNANSIEDKKLKTNFDDEQSIVFARININDFNFIHTFDKNDRDDLKSELLEDNKPLIYAPKGRIKVFLCGEKDENDIKTNEDLELENKLDENKDESTADKNDEEHTTLKSNLKNTDFEKTMTPGHWFLVNLQNIGFIKKNKFNNEQKDDVDLITFISLIKYKEIKKNDDDQNNNHILKEAETNNVQEVRCINVLFNFNMVSKPKDTHLQPQEFFYRANENSNYIAIYQPKSCKFHSKRNDFWCKDCNKFCCLQCLVEDKPDVSHKTHKVHLLDEILTKSDEDSNALDERIKNLKKVIDSEIQNKKMEINKLKEKNKEKVDKIKKLFEDKNMNISQEEKKRMRLLGALAGEVLRIINDYNKKTGYLTFLYEKGTMANYLTNYYIFQRVFKNDIYKNLQVLERKINELYNYYISNKNRDNKDNNNSRSNSIKNG